MQKDVQSREPFQVSDRYSPIFHHGETDSKPVQFYVGLLVGKVAGGQVFRQVLRFFSVITTPPMFRIHSHSVIHWQHITLTSNVAK